MIEDSAIPIEDIRESYRPKVIRLLFIGESPPANGSFFYLGNSNLYRHTQQAFADAFGRTFDDGHNFLRFFKEQECYLDDLCNKPVNQIKGKAMRRQMRRDSQQSLAERITSYQPEAIVVVMKAISKDVEEALRIADSPLKPIAVLPFPGRWPSHIKDYTRGLVQVLHKVYSTI